MKRIRVYIYVYIGIPIQAYRLDLLMVGTCNEFTSTGEFPEENEFLRIKRGFLIPGAIPLCLIFPLFSSDIPPPPECGRCSVFSFERYGEEPTLGK